jgi:eukaryotic-like serine/threonine-protein kinase
MSDRPKSLKSGDKLGAYRIERELGSGGMADVFYAVHEGLRRPAAIKVLRASLATDEVHLQRFMQEARAAASLIHPNIVQVYDVGQDGDHRYIAQEYVPGSNLRQYLDAQGQMPVRETISVLMQILAALSKSAAVGIVHRDIKPENIMLTQDGDVKVADYGLARVLLGDDPQLTRAGTTLGTPMYMSPEQIQEGIVDIRSDLYSLGVTLFHMLAGQPPFRGETPLALAMQHVQAEPPSLSELRNDLPASLTALVHRLLSKKPVDRFANPTEVIEKLRESRSDDLKEFWPEQTIPLPGALRTGVRGPSAATLLMQSRKSQERAKKMRRALASIIAPLIGISLGAVTAVTWHRDLLATSEPTTQIVKRDSVKEQFADALLSADDNRLRWEAIPMYFPPMEKEINRLYAGKAWLQLARLHLEKDDFDQARKSLSHILEDPLMPPVLRILAGIRLSEVESKAGNRELAEAALKSAKELEQRERLTTSDQELIDQFLDPL